MRLLPLLPLALLAGGTDLTSDYSKVRTLRTTSELTLEIETVAMEMRIDDESHEQTGFERSQCLRAALERLPEDQREVLVLRHVAGLTPGEIAKRLGKTEGSIHGLHHRGRGALQAALKQLEAAPVIAAAG